MIFKPKPSSTTVPFGCSKTTNYLRLTPSGSRQISVFRKLTKKRLVFVHAYLQALVNQHACSWNICTVAWCKESENDFYRASYASTVLAVIVCLSVCLSQVVVRRWLNLGSH